MNAPTPLQSKLDEAAKAKYGKGYQELAASLRSPVLKAIEELLKIWIREPERRKAAAITLGEMGVWTQTSLIPEAPKAGPEDLAEAMAMMAESHLDSRDALAAFLKSLLEDGRVLETQPRPGREETPPPSRICDEAYLYLRRLLKPGESAEERLLGEKAFRDMDDAEKDSAIRAAKDNGEWKALWQEEE
jgi:hypothetical protein